MNENSENIKIDELLEELHYLRARNDFLERCVNGLKLHNHQITQERNQSIEKMLELQRELSDIKELSMFEFGNKFCSEESLEEDGHRFARALLGGA